MTVRKMKGRTTWNYEFQHNHQRHSKGGFATKQEALEAETLHRKSLRKQAGDITLSYLIIMRANELHAKTTTAYYIECMSVFNKFTKHLNGSVNMVSEVTRDSIEEFLSRQYRSPRAYNYALKIIRALFNYGISKMWFDTNPTRGIQIRAFDKKKKYIPSKEDLDRVIEKAEGTDKVFLVALKFTMARVSEIYSLTWGDVDFNNQTITLWTRKKRGGARTPRTLPMTEELRKALSTLEYKSEYVFTNQKTMGKFDDRKKLLIGLCKRAKVRRFGFHSIRHWGASQLARKNVPLPDIKELLGHENLTTTAIYIQSLIGSTSKSIHLLE